MTKYYIKLMLIFFISQGCNSEEYLYKKWGIAFNSIRAEKGLPILTQQYVKCPLQSVTIYKLLKWNLKSNPNYSVEKKLGLDENNNLVLERTTIKTKEKGYTYSIIEVDAFFKKDSITRQLFQYQLFSNEALIDNLKRKDSIKFMNISKALAHKQNLATEEILLMIILDGGDIHNYNTLINSRNLSQEELEQILAELDIPQSP